MIMPIYEYQCKECRKIHEIWQKINEKPAERCPDCGGQLHKLVSLSSFQLKGGGWYADGYTNGKKQKGNGKDIDVKPAAAKQGTSDGGEKKTQKQEKKAASADKAT